MLKKDFKILKTNTTITGKQLMEYIHHKTILMAENSYGLRGAYVSSGMHGNKLVSLFIHNLNNFVNHNLLYHKLTKISTQNVYKFYAGNHSLILNSIEGSFSSDSLSNFRLMIGGLQLSELKDQKPTSSYCYIHELEFTPRELTKKEEQLLHYQYCDIPFSLEDLLEYSLDDYQITDNDKVTEKNKKLIKEGKLPVHYGDDDKPIKIVKTSRRSAMAAIP